jgi:hypothetical protein
MKPDKYSAPVTWPADEPDASDERLWIGFLGPDGRYHPLQKSAARPPHFTEDCNNVWQGSELQVKADCDQANWEAEREENNRD